MNLVDLHHAVFAVGLVWTPPVRRHPGRKALLSEAHKRDVSFDVQARTGSRKGLSQNGYGASDGHWKRWRNARALCACLDVPPSFLGLFPLKTAGGKRIWWLYCRVDGVIPERGDLACASEEEAMSMLRLMHSVSGLKERTICESPEESARFLSERCRLRPADVWLRDLGRLHNLNLAISRTTAQRGIAALVLAAIVGGSLAAWDRYARHAAYEAARIAREAKLQRQKDLKEHPEKFFDMAWQKAPLAADAARQCLPAMMDVPLSSQGWMLEQASCNGKNVGLQWRHADGGSFIAPPDNGALDRKNARLAQSTRKARDIALSPRPDGPGTDHRALLSVEKASALLYELAQTTNTRLKLSFKKPASKTVDKVAITAPWQVGAFEIADVPDILMGVTGDASGFFETLSAIPGLTISDITFRDGWTVKGMIHAR
ncbi:type 4b pilus protein PilO2 [uncultured Desulfovibrio sp.]|uniref:type 4b pilus protein PilO2 n=1 Tax=uncultured Desulfovibrio sp. TaxID=167968 RepID=UPI0026049245|nr:type 4b pilus protein PilO2 [uncultured Desulfovibrio sp.]